MFEAYLAHFPAVSLALQGCFRRNIGEEVPIGEEVNSSSKHIIFFSFSISSLFSLYTATEPRNTTTWQEKNNQLLVYQLAFVAVSLWLFCAHFPTFSPLPRLKMFWS